MPPRKPKQRTMRAARPFISPGAPGAARPELSTPLSKNFTLKELLRSPTAERDEGLKAEQENPPPEVIASLQYLVQTALQPMRNGIATPLQITSGYRCPVVNKLVGGSATSQHCLGEAADCELLPAFLTDPAFAATREAIRQGVRQATGQDLRPEVDHNFYLFAYVCLHLEELDVDQVIHEYGDGFGHPAWVHVAASRRQDKRQILFVGSYTNRQYVQSSVVEALKRGTN